ncbi:uncharacterized protein At5g19025-like isoform X1 [Dendrobium catenatum]|uniref:60S ribosomal protein L34 n=1 Tax=Dendrobium catenatum TaxID=906689 RepID=A0A2I0X2X3_9ASPA|nr:uncharacterized protein At5g19025-like isoform X1 [Dendrobium catenatum]XP_020680646.1 uncharacterized protein At5g19025-like isoform X1 [Dendrobium catenatum]PKU82263.1 Uncharacterized protein MA16_Dca017485 [Dendrobium catenatum]
MVDCRSLIEFCRAFEQHRQAVNLQASPENRSNKSHGRSNTVNLFSQPFCEHSPFAAMDFLMLLLVLGSFGVLTLPYFKFIYKEAYELFPVAVDLMGEVVCPRFVTYVIGFALMLITGVALWGVFSHQFRKCGNPKCKGLRKAVEFDIQLESEECVRFMPAIPMDAFGSRQLELGQDHKELEAELKKMAPLNGRTVLIFRSPCGCPIGRMEVWGPKKVRRIKK